MQHSPGTSSPAARSRTSDEWPEELSYIPRRNRVFVISGPGGVGKDEIIKQLPEHISGLRKIVTNTTRLPRDGERPDEDYHFCSEEEFDLLIARNGLLEYAGYVRKRYGTPALPVRLALDAGEDVVLKIEAQGAMRVKSRLPGAVLIFIAPESLAELERRLRARGKDSEDAIAERLRRAPEELSLAGLYDYVVVNRNGRMGEAVEQIATIVRAERLRANPHPIDLG